MLQDLALSFSCDGYNCSQCILKACEEAYGIPVSVDAISMCGPVCTGCGVGTICSVLIGAIMVFGIMFDEETAKRLRIRLLYEFNQDYPSINCSELRNNGNENICDEVIAKVAEITEKIINEELK